MNSVALSISTHRTPPVGHPLRLVTQAAKRYASAYQRAQRDNYPDFKAKAEKHLEFADADFEQEAEAYRKWAESPTAPEDLSPSVFPPPFIGKRPLPAADDPQRHLVEIAREYDDAVVQTERLRRAATEAELNGLPPRTIAAKWKPYAISKLKEARLLKLYDSEARSLRASQPQSLEGSESDIPTS